MRISLSPARLCGQIPAIPSKSYLHRALICAALSKGKSHIGGNPFSQDIDATVSALKSLNVQIIADGEGFTVSPGKFPKKAELFCRESGSTLRFLTPVTAALGIDALFTGEGRLPERPMEPLFALLREHGAEVSQTTTRGLPFRVFGRLKPGIFTLPGNISSQYITGLLLALPLCESDSKLRVLPPFESRPYVELTMEVMARFGAAARENDGVFHIPGRQSYRPCVLSTEGDWSNAAFWLCAGALGGDITVTGLSPASKQGDRDIIRLLKKMGADITELNGGYRAKKSPLEGIDIDASQIPDLVPVLAVCGAFAKGRTRITGAARLRLKESDRLDAVANTLTALGADITQHEDGLCIAGGKPLDGGFAKGYNDHRIVMSLAVAALGCRGDVIIDGARCVEKSYPRFFDDYRALGGIADGLNMG